MSHKKLNKPEFRICKICGKEFKTTLVDKIYCNDKCLSRARVLRLQEMYESGEIGPHRICEEAYYEITNFLKNILATELIKKGYFISGVRQNNYTNDELLDCFVFVMQHVFGTFVKKNGKQTKTKYNPARANLTTFINTWARGYCSLVKQAEDNRRNRDKNIVLSLDEVIETYTPNELVEDILIHDVNDRLEYAIFNKDIDKQSYKEFEEEFKEELEDIHIDFN